jgi:hypothetical protein
MSWNSRPSLFVPLLVSVSIADREMWLEQRVEPE